MPVAVSMPGAPVELMRRELQFPTKVDDIHLVGAAVTVNVPSGASWVLLLPTATIYACATGAAVSPSSTVVDGTGSFPVFTQYGIFFNVKSLTTFSLFGTAEVAACWYADRGV
jgi:hypothetical protein